MLGSGLGCWCDWRDRIRFDICSQEHGVAASHEAGSSLGVFVAHWRRVHRHVSYWMLCKVREKQRLTTAGTDEAMFPISGNTSSDWMGIPRSLTARWPRD